MIRGYGGLLELLIHLIEQFLRLGRMTGHIELVGGLRGGDLLVRLGR